MFTRILTLTSGVILAISLIGCSSVDHSKPEVVAPGPMSIDDMALADDMVGRWKWSAPNFGDEVQVPLKARYSLKFGGSMASSGDGTWIDDGDQLHLAQWSTVNVEERRVSITYRGWFNKSQRKTYLYTVSGTISEDGIFITGTYRYQSLAGDAPIDVTGDFSGMRSFDG